jgi:hypothetical protein
LSRRASRKCLEDQDILGKSTIKESFQKFCLVDQDILGKSGELPEAKPGGSGHP